MRPPLFFLLSCSKFYLTKFRSCYFLSEVSKPFKLNNFHFQPTWSCIQYVNNFNQILNSFPSPTIVPLPPTTPIALSKQDVLCPSSLPPFLYSFFSVNFLKALTSPASPGYCFLVSLSPVQPQSSLLMVEDVFSHLQNTPLLARINFCCAFLQNTKLNLVTSSEQRHKCLSGNHTMHFLSPQQSLKHQLPILLLD